MSRPFFSARAGRLSLWLGGAALAFLMFVRITRELIEGDVGAMDSAILLAVAKKRTPWLTIAAVDVTALGSITLVALFSAFTLLVLLVLRDRMGALQLLVASAGAGVFTIVTKDVIERIRPAEAQQLIVVSGFSYPTDIRFRPRALSDNRNHRRPLRAALWRKSRDFRGRVGGAYHGWCLARVPWRSLCD